MWRTPACNNSVVYNSKKLDATSIPSGEDWLNKAESSLQCTEVRRMYAALGLIKDDCFIVNDIHF